MYRLLNLLKRYHPLLLMLLLEVLAVSYYARSTAYSRAKIIAASNRVAGNVHGIFSSVGEWFSLGRENVVLLERLAAVETELAAYKGVAEGVPASGMAESGESQGIDGAGRVELGRSGREIARFMPDSISLGGISDNNASDTTHVALPPAPSIEESKYFYSWARVINNTINREENHFIIDKGMNDGVERNMSVISADGAVAGYVEEVSANFSVCMSILNRNFRMGGRVRGKDYIGSIFWQGNRSDEVMLSDIPQYASIEVGDTIVSAVSSRFPPDVFIGTVRGGGSVGESGLFQVGVELGADIARLRSVMLVRYDDSQELESLEEQYMGATQGHNAQFSQSGQSPQNGQNR